MRERYGSLLFSLSPFTFLALQLDLYSVRSAAEKANGDGRDKEDRGQKGNEKAEEVFALLKRTTDPQTVYKKQKLDGMQNIV